MKTNKLHYSILILFFQLNLSNAFGYFSEFNTPWLKSTAGTGVASILMDEATMLNPAPLAFFQVGSLYVQKGTVKPQAQENSPTVNENVDNLGFVMSDSKGNTGGSLSYEKQKDTVSTQETMGVALAYPTGKSSSMGLAYQKKKLQENGSLDKKSERFTLGVSHSWSPDWTFGLIAHSPSTNALDSSMAIMGLQYVYKQFLSIMADFGADYKQDLTTSSLVRGAAQFKLMGDLYFRIGASDDKAKKTRANGIGIGWIGPRLVLNSSYSYTKAPAKNYQDKEVALSLSYKF